MITGDCADRLYSEVVHWAKVSDYEMVQSRAGLVKQLDEPLTTCLYYPDRRVLFNEERNCNPFFHLMEAIWMFASNDGPWIVNFNKNMAQFMEKDNTFHGAYGKRWFAQVPQVVELLTEDPKTRRAYMTIWDNWKDLGNNGSKDLPCNVGMAFQVRRGALNGYVFNRSNDLIWGMMGSNLVHFSMLLEVVAYLSSLPLGALYQLTVNPHFYERHFGLVEDHVEPDPVPYPHIYPLQPTSYRTWVTDARSVVDGVTKPSMYHNDFYPDVVLPMIAVWERRGSTKAIAAKDWRLAAEQWIGRNRNEQAA